MMQPIVTLTTDFGFGTYVAQIKAVLLGYRRDIQLVDIAHDIPPQNISHAATLLADVSTRFPSETYHLAVVDPGVGTNRKIVYVEAGLWRYILPDNGLIGLVAAQWPVNRIIHLTQPQFWSSTVSPTFHGRDIIAHAAGHLLQGTDPLELGELLLEQDLVKLPLREARHEHDRIQGEIESVDHFGNLITNLSKANVQRLCETQKTAIRDLLVKSGGIEISLVWDETYGNHASGTIVAIFDSQDRLELAVVTGDAAQTLGLRVGNPIEVVCGNGRSVEKRGDT